MLRHFRYTAQTARGERVRGLAAAENREDLSRRLYEQGLYLRSAREQAEKRWKSAALAEFCRQLGGMLSSGVSLVRSLEILGQEKAMEGVCGMLLAQLRSGESLSGAMERVFPPLMVGMVRAGETSGTLDQTLSRLHRHYEKQHEVEQELRSALTYPALLCVMALVTIVGVFTLILPNFTELFEEIPQLPLATRILMAASDYLVECWYMPLLCLCLGAAGVRLLSNLPEVRLRLDRWKLALPLFGSVYAALYTARFARGLASLYAGGTTILPALETVRETLDNAYLHHQMEDVLAAVKNGVSLSRSLEQVKGFRAKLISAIQVGEESGDLDTMLEGIANTMEFDARQSAKRLLTVLEPALVVCMAAVIGFMMVGVVLPMVDAYAVIEQSAVF